MLHVRLADPFDRFINVDADESVTGKYAVNAADNATTRAAIAKGRLIPTSAAQVTQDATAATAEGVKIENAITDRAAIDADFQDAYLAYID